MPLFVNRTFPVSKAFAASASMLAMVVLAGVSGPALAEDGCRLGSATLAKGEVVILPRNGVVLECASGGWVLQRMLDEPAAVPVLESGKSSRIAKRIQQFLKNSRGEGQCEAQDCNGVVDAALKEEMIDYVAGEIGNTIEPDARFEALWGTAKKEDLAQMAQTLANADLLHAFYVTVIAGE